LETFEQNIEKNGSEEKELLERKIGEKKATEIGAALLSGLSIYMHACNCTTYR